MYYQLGRSPVSPKTVSQQEKVDEVEVEVFNDSVNRLFSKFVFSLNLGVPVLCVERCSVCGARSLFNLF
jgi:hypothetical protein